MQDGNGRAVPHGQMAMKARNLHSAWLQFIRYCAELGYGEIEKLKIQDGLPMAAEVTTRKVKFSP